MKSHRNAYTQNAQFLARYVTRRIHRPGEKLSGTSANLQFACAARALFAFI